MYKFYVNTTAVCLLTSADLQHIDLSADSVDVELYPGNKKFLAKIIDLVERELSHLDALYIHYPVFKKLKSDFQSIFKTIPACGGLVYNEYDEILFIHRRGSWDLPKGKAEKNETRRETALREVREETGVKGLKIIDDLHITRHLFTGRSGRRYIKKSYWYLMETKKQPLIAQTEEDIIEACWMTYEQWQEREGTTYENIREVLKLGQNLKVPVARAAE